MTDCEQKLELATHAIFARFRYMWNSYLDVVFFSSVGALPFYHVTKQPLV